MKTNAIIRIVLFSIAILVLAGILFVGLATHFFVIDTVSGFLPVASDGLTSQGAVKASDVENLEIEWVAGSIVIQPDENTDQITISETDPGNDKDRMVFKLDGSTLAIQFCKESIDFPSFGINTNISKDLLITVPADWNCSTLDIEAASADVRANDLTIREVKFEGASGEFSFSNCTVDDIDVNTVSGNVDFVGTLNHFDCEAVSSDCYVEVSNIPESICVEGVSGNLELYLPDDCGFTAGINTVSGKVTYDFDTKFDGKHHVYGTGDCEIDLECMSGDVSIRKNLSSTTETYYVDDNHSHSGGRQN